VTFEIDAVYQRTVAELTARGSPLWMIFVPLAVDAAPERMGDVLNGLRAQTSARDFGELASAMTVVAAREKRRRGLRECILGLLSKEDVMKGGIYQMGKQDGREESVTALFEKRLQRPLDDAERATLLQRLTSLGFDHLVDVRDERSPEALAAWLHDPQAA
jgi:hypothetical protein